MQTAKIVLSGLVLAASAALTGCQQAGTNAGTYTEMRHRSLGSNIPQPDSVTTAGYTYHGDVAAAAGGLNVMTPSQNSVGPR